MYLSMPSIPLHLQYAALMNCRWYMIILPDSIKAAVAAVADLMDGDVNDDIGAIILSVGGQELTFRARDLRRDILIPPT